MRVSFPVEKVCEHDLLPMSGTGRRSAWPAGSPRRGGAAARSPLLRRSDGRGRTTRARPPWIVLLSARTLGRANPLHMTSTNQVQNVARLVDSGHFRWTSRRLRWEDAGMGASVPPDAVE